MQKEKQNFCSRLTKNLKPGKHKPQRWVAKESFFPDQSLIIDGHSLLEFKVNDELEMIDAKVQKVRVEDKESHIHLFWTMITFRHERCT